MAQLPSRSGGAGTLLITAFMLFSMFFGAGNLIFPPQLGAAAGDAFLPAILGFLAAGVLLPVLAIIAVAMSGASVRDLARRAGPVFGLVFPVVAYLSIGACYALPRTGAVSFSIAVSPVTGWGSPVASAVFNALFFGLALALAARPSAIVTALGQWLTPVLLVLLAVLTALALAAFPTASAPPRGDYAVTPAGAGLLQGYLTMDSIAALAFGIVVVSALRHRGVPLGAPLARRTMLAGLGAGLLLAVIYLGLGLIGNRMPQAAGAAGAADGDGDGAALLAAAAERTMGTPGQVLFGGIVLLACLTTAVGLIAATGEFFHLLAPGIPYRAWASVFAVMSFGLATAGLETVLSVAAPVVALIYPPAITLILLTLISPLLGRAGPLHCTYRAAIWTATAWSALTVAGDLGALPAGWPPEVPGQPISLGWVVPTLLATTAGFAADLLRGTRARTGRAEG